MVVLHGLNPGGERVCVITMELVLKEEDLYIIKYNYNIRR